MRRNFLTRWPRRLAGTTYGTRRDTVPSSPRCSIPSTAPGAARTDVPDMAEARIENLSAPVNVWYDRRGVPHIFAINEADAVRALAMLVARDRLFQLCPVSRRSGRLTERRRGPSR
jgi:penicillin amidase